MKYRKKPVVIEAFRWTGDIDQSDDPVWIVEALKKPWGVGTAEIVKTIEGIKMKIWTLEGIHLACTGDFIIRGIKSEIYPCKPDIFEATYELVEVENK